MFFCGNFSVHLRLEIEKEEWFSREEKRKRKNYREREIDR